MRWFGKWTFDNLKFLFPAFVAENLLKMNLFTVNSLLEQKCMTSCMSGESVRRPHSENQCALVIRLRSDEVQRKIWGLWQKEHQEPGVQASRYASDFGQETWWLWCLGKLPSLILSDCDSRNTLEAAWIFNNPCHSLLFLIIVSCS